MLGYKEVFIGTSVEKYRNFMRILADNDIKFKTEISDRSSEWLGHGTIRSNFSNIGNTDNTIYYIFVKKKHFEKADFLLRNVNN